MPDSNFLNYLQVCWIRPVGEKLHFQRFRLLMRQIMVFLDSSFSLAVEYGVKWQSNRRIIHRSQSWTLALALSTGRDRCRPLPPPSLPSPSPLHSILPWMSWSTSELISCSRLLHTYPNYENPTQGHPGTQPSPSRAARPPISPSPVAQLHPSSCPFFWRQNLFQIFSSCKLQDGPTSQYNGTCLSLHLYPLLKPCSKQKS